MAGATRRIWKTKLSENFSHMHEEIKKFLIIKQTKKPQLLSVL